MIYRCRKCENEMNLSKGSKYCPKCGGEITPIDIGKKIADLHMAGKTPKEISHELKVSELIVIQMLAKLALDSVIPTDGLIQVEYGPEINKIMAGDWGGKLKTIKTALSPECTYTTIQYFARQNRRENAKERDIKKVDEIYELITQGKSIEDIAKAVGFSNYRVSRLFMDEIAKNHALAAPYLDEHYTEDIIKIVENPDWNGRVNPVKKALPDDVSYSTICATLAVHRK